MSHRMHALLVVFLFNVCSVASSLQVTSTPPLLDVPTYSLATLGSDGTTGMNILTYATPVSTSPDRAWSVGLYKGTVAHENFCRSRSGVLQLLRPRHAKLVRLLGGASGRDVDKQSECEKLGFEWTSLIGDKDSPLLLSGCAYYIQLELMGEVIDAGSHDVAVCRVESMFVDGEASGETSYLSTGTLRDMGIISNLGRVAVPWAEDDT